MEIKNKEDKSMTFAEMKRRLKKAPKKDLLKGFLCFAVMLALIVWYVVVVVLG